MIDVVATSPTATGATERAPRAVLEAVLERITYANEETGYTIAWWPPTAPAGTC
jgi:hypothetical protein